MEELILKLHAIGAIKFGTFPLKRNFIAPFQVDLSLALSHPDVAKQIASRFSEKMEAFPHDLLCGVSPVGNSLAAYLAWTYDHPLVLRQEEQRDREGAPKILGHYKTGQRCLLIGGVTLSGASSLDRIDDLEAEGIEVKDLLIFLDLEQGAKQKIKGRGYSPHILINLSQACQILYDHEKIGGDTFKLVTDFLEGEQR